MAKAYLIEHGQTAMDRKGNVHGHEHAGEPLDHHGRQQAVRLGVALRRLYFGAPASGLRLGSRRAGGPGRPSPGASPPSRIYTSPARRALQTAQIAGAVAGVPVEVAPELRPLDAGDLAEGNQRQAAARLKPYWDNPRRQIPNGETVAAWRRLHRQFAARVAEAAKRRGERPPALVTHSAVVGSLEGGAKQAGKSMADPPAAAEARLVEVGGGR